MVEINEEACKSLVLACGGSGDARGGDAGRLCKLPFCFDFLCNILQDSTSLITLFFYLFDFYDSTSLKCILKKVFFFLFFHSNVYIVDDFTFNSSQFSSYHFRCG